MPTGEAPPTELVRWRMWLDRLASAPLDSLEYGELLRTRSTLPEALEISDSEQWWAELDELDEQFLDLTIGVGQNPLNIDARAGWWLGRLPRSENDRAYLAQDRAHAGTTSESLLEVATVLLKDFGLSQVKSVKVLGNVGVPISTGRAAVDSTISEGQPIATDAARDSVEAAELTNQASHFRYTLHEVPTGVLWGVDGADRAQCAELLNELEDFASATSQAGVSSEFGKLIAACRFHYVAYANYLDSVSLPSYQSYLDEVHDGFCPTGQ